MSDNEPTNIEANDLRIRVYSVVDFGNSSTKGCWAKIRCRVEKPSLEEVSEEIEKTITLPDEDALEHFCSAVNSLDYADLFNIDKHGFYISLGSSFDNDSQEEDPLASADMSKMN